MDHMQNQLSYDMVMFILGVQERGMSQKLCGSFLLMVGRVVYILWLPF